MNREALIQFAYDTSERLHVGNETYKQWVFRYTFLELEKDLGEKGDITTGLFTDFDKKVTAKIIAKANGIVAGLEEVRYFLCDSDVAFRPRLKDEFSIHFHFQDGDGVKPGDVIADIEAPASAILAVERVVLNLIGRLSGVATNAAELAYKVQGYNVKLAGTRKTAWGLLDKKALSVSGVLPHRLNLADAIIVKDTHLDLIKRDFSVLFKLLVEQIPECRFVEIEVLDKEEALDVARLLNDHDLQQVGIIMLDNMLPDAVADTLEAVKAEGLHETVLFEASGGINSENLEEYAKTGIDVISMGSLTNYVKPLDVSLKMFGGRGGTRTLTDCSTSS